MKTWLRNLFPPLACVALMFGTSAHTADAADYPVMPIRLVVAGPPAGGTDSIARIISAELSQSLGQSIIVENRAGAGGINNLAELLAKGKALGGLTYGSPGVGLPQHIVGFALAKASGVSMQHVPYRGSAPAIVDLIGGQISMMFVTPGAAVPFLKSGQLRAIAVTSGERSRFFPDVPTMTELGFPSLEQTVWFGVFAPAGTPSGVVQALSTQIGRAIAKPPVRAKLEAMYLESAADSSSHAFASFVKSEVAKWSDVVQKLGVSAE